MLIYISKLRFLNEPPPRSSYVVYAQNQILTALINGKINLLEKT